jgi:hypothetical protein
MRIEVLRRWNYAIADFGMRNEKPRAAGIGQKRIALWVEDCV